MSFSFLLRNSPNENKQWSELTPPYSGRNASPQKRHIPSVGVLSPGHAAFPNGNGRHPTRTFHSVPRLTPAADEWAAGLALH